MVKDIWEEVYFQRTRRAYLPGLSTFIFSATIDASVSTIISAPSQSSESSGEPQTGHRSASLGASALHFLQALKGGSLVLLLTLANLVPSHR